MVEVKMDDPGTECPVCGFWKSPNNHQCAPCWKWTFDTRVQSWQDAYAHSPEDAIKGAMKKLDGEAPPSYTFRVVLLMPATRVDAERLHWPPEGEPVRYRVGTRMEAVYTITEDERV